MTKITIGRMPDLYNIIAGFMYIILYIYIYTSWHSVMGDSIEIPYPCIPRSYHLFPYAQMKPRRVTGNKIQPYVTLLITWYNFDLIMDI